MPEPAYQREAEGYARLSRSVEKLQRGAALDDAERKQLAERLGDDPALRDALAALDGRSRAATDAVLEALIDRHGTGRVMFRNRRAAVGGFPQRKLDFRELDGRTLDDGRRQRLLAEFMSDTQQPPAPLALDYADDPRLPWLLQLLDSRPEDKFFLVCRSQAKVLALEEALRTRSGVKLARFHEALTLLQRDRNAAFFAQKDGARLLLCAEIGSEGRNFQFAHHLILWDLPLDPDQLEQRIGRLDRIGQRHDIEIHCAAFVGSAQHVLVRWFRDGLDAFRSSPADGREPRLPRARVLSTLVRTERGRRLLVRYGTRVDPQRAPVVSPPLDLAAEIAPVPVAIVHGGRDRYVPLRDARELYARLGEPRVLVVLPEFGHAEAGFDDAFAEMLESLIGRLLASPPLREV